MRCRSDHDAAVSPVVGVMLMLSVTIMIAAIVSTYAGGFTGGAEKSPQSSIKASPNLENASAPRIYFEHNGGDPFLLSSISIVLREHDNKTSLALSDSGSDLVKKFAELGADSGNADTTIRAGDSFFIEGTGLDSGNGMKFGSVILRNNTKITWLIVDRETSKAISTGTFYL